MVGDGGVFRDGFELGGDYGGEHWIYVRLNCVSTCYIFCMVEKSTSGHGSHLK